MAVEAVVSVVIEKLTGLIEKSLIVDEVIDQVEEIRIAVRRRMMQGAEAEKLECLRILYKVEDIIETALARHQTRRSSLWPIGGFFNHLMSDQSLHQKMLKIGNQIKQSNDQKQDCAADGFNSVSSSSSAAHDEDPEEDPGISAPHDEDPEEAKEANGSIDIDSQVSDDQILTPALACIRRISSAPSFNEFLRPRTLAVNFSLEEEGDSSIEGFQVSDDQVLTPALACIPRISSAPSFNEFLRPRRLAFNFSLEEEGDSSIEGFQEDVNRLVNQLTQKDDDHLVIMSIVGEVGSGKTTLAHAIYKNRRTKCFKCRVLVSISKCYSQKDVLVDILKQMGSLEDKDELMTSEQLLESRLPEALQKMSCLIVLDDVQAGDVWEKLMPAFAKYTRHGSKMIITTCDESVAKNINSIDENLAHPRSITHVMRRLNESDSWKMFLKNTRLPETSIGNSLLKQKILEKCEGLPLRIVLLGGLLSTKKEASCDEWFRVFDHTNWDILSLSYNDLLVHSKLCLLYLALFPKEFEIPVRRLLRLWLAEGFVKRSPPKIPEDVVQDYFEDLVKRNMIKISKLRSDGSARRCILLGALRDNLLSKAREISLFHIHHDSDSCGAAHDQVSVRRIIEYVDINNCKPSQFQNLRSYLSFTIQKKDTPATQVGQFVSKIIGKKGFGLLRVLDLEGVYKPSLPDNLGDLFHLRYLGLRWTFLEYLPSSVGNLTYLETLDVKHTYINSLPNSIWKLKHLRHLNLNEIRLEKPLSFGLLTLWGLIIDHKSPVRNSLNRLSSLRELGITLHLSDDREDIVEVKKKKDDIADWVANLTGLQSLRLRSKDERGCPMDLCLKPLSGLGKLSHLYLLGNLQKLPDKCDFPPAVKVLTLSVSWLKEDPMPILGRLPSLTVLRLLADSFLGKKITCRGFSKLRVLKLWMLKELEEWELKKGAMQSLIELNIRCCRRLKSIPQRLLQSSKLEELILTNMPKEFVADVCENKFNHYPTIKNWDFTPLPWEQDILSDREQ